MELGKYGHTDGMYGEIQVAGRGGKRVFFSAETTRMDWGLDPRNARLTKSKHGWIEPKGSSRPSHSNEENWRKIKERKKFRTRKGINARSHSNKWIADNARRASSSFLHGEATLVSLEMGEPSYEWKMFLRSAFLLLSSFPLLGEIQVRFSRPARKKRREEAFLQSL